MQCLGRRSIYLNTENHSDACVIGQRGLLYWNSQKLFIRLQIRMGICTVLMGEGVGLKKSIN